VTFSYNSPDLRILQELIHPDAQILPTNHRKPQLILQETKTDKPYSVTVRYSGKTEAIAVIADRFPAAKQFFADSRKECKRADYLIFADTPKGNYIVCVEMKSKSGNNSDIIAQLKGAQCLAAYCRRIGQIFWEETNFLKDYHFRFVSLKNMTANKPPSRNSRKAKHDRPETPLRLHSCQEISLQELIGG